LTFLILDNQDSSVLIIQVDKKQSVERRDSVDSIPTPSRGSIGGSQRNLQRGRTISLPDDPNLWIGIKDAESLIDLQPQLSYTFTQKVNSTSAQYYRPPVFSARIHNESDVPPPVIRDSLMIEEFPMGKITTVYINMVKQGLNEWLRVPVIIARGEKDGPVVKIYLYFPYILMGNIGRYNGRGSRE
jgi:hypothetical protein